ncbi:hypothetical protein [uncultured Shewanella sp.]|uniref:hypothetical protein n=1 Tax=uncultured Shewanella sp. TaxID=173975 RepID=UPI0026176C3B|nr:hypothetical protein [uncultured Shewanella sp.]
MGDIVKQKMYGGYFVLKSNYWEIFGNEYKSVVGSEQKINLGSLTDIKIVASFEFNLGPRVETSLWHNVYTLKNWKLIAQEDEFKGEVNAIVANKFETIAEDSSMKASEFQAMLNYMRLITQQIEAVNNRVTTVNNDLKSSITEVKQRVTVVDDVSAKLQKVAVAVNDCETKISNNIIDIALNTLSLQDNDLTVMS